MMSFMTCFHRVHIMPKKNSRTGSLFESCFLVDRYLVSTGSFMASSKRFFAESSWYAGISRRMTSFYFRCSFLSSRMSIINLSLVPFIVGRKVFSAFNLEKVGRNHYIVM